MDQGKYPFGTNSYAQILSVRTIPHGIGDQIKKYTLKRLLIALNKHRFLRDLDLHLKFLLGEQLIKIQHIFPAALTQIHTSHLYLCVPGFQLGKCEKLVDQLHNFPGLLFHLRNHLVLPLRFQAHDFQITQDNGHRCPDVMGNVGEHIFRRDLGPPEICLDSLPVIQKTVDL